MKFIFIFLILFSNLFSFQLEGITFNKSLIDGYKEFTVTNEGTIKSRYKISILPSKKNEDISDCLEIFPKILTVEAKSTAVFKIFGNAKRELEEKEYFFILTLEPIVIPTLLKPDGASIKGNSAAAIVPTIEMKGHGGKIDYSKYLNIDNIYFGKENESDTMFFKLHNYSHGAVEGGVVIYDKKGNAFTSKPFGILGKNTHKDFSIKLNGFSKDDIEKIVLLEEDFTVLKSFSKDDLKI